MVRGPAHCPRADVVQLVASAWAPDFIALSVLKELSLAIALGSRSGSVVSYGDERQSSQNGGDGHDIDDRLCFRLIQLLCPALASLPPPRGGIPVWIVQVHLWFAIGLHSVTYILTFQEQGR